MRIRWLQRPQIECLCAPNSSSFVQRLSSKVKMASYDSPELRDQSPNKDVMADEHMSPGRYLATRFPTLKPPMAKAPNPFKLLALLNLQQWLFFLVAFLAWSWDAFDFFTVSLTVTELSKEFDKKPSQITWGITLVLMFRSVGAIIFGETAMKCCISECEWLMTIIRNCLRSVWKEMAVRRE